jgi:hypothetical protein
MKLEGWGSASTHPYIILFSLGLWSWRGEGHLVVASRDFAPYQLGDMIHPNLIVKKFTFIFRHFVYSATSSNVHPAQLTLSPIHNHKTKYENTFSKNEYGNHHSQKFM